MTWKEFKEWAEKTGIRDNDEIRFIDTTGVFDVKDLCFFKSERGIEIN